MHRGRILFAASIGLLVGPSLAPAQAVLREEVAALRPRPQPGTTGGGGTAAPQPAGPDHTFDDVPTTVPADLPPPVPETQRALPPFQPIPQGDDETRRRATGERFQTSGAESLFPSRTVSQGDFLPVPDRWRIGIPGNYTENTRSSLFNPYRQNVLKGDYPIVGQDGFLELTLTSDTLVEARRNPVPSGVSTREPNRFDFFGQGESQFLIQNFIVSGEFFIGDPGYLPKDFAVKATTVFNINYVHTNEYNLVNPDPRKGRDRADGDVAFQELFVEKKLADLSPNFDFISVRAGIQGFTSDFRGFLFSDNEPGVRLFGNIDNNRIQYNFAWFSQLEKDTNSGLNTLDARNQNVFIANLFRQDFIFEGYTAQFSFHANIDQSGGFQYDKNGFLVRPAPFGTVPGLGFPRRKEVDAFYLGWAGDGHIGRFNITHQFYQVLGQETYNQIAGRHTIIDAQFAAVEVSYDQDFIRYRAAVAYESGDNKPENGRATGFDTIFDNPNFAGGGFNYLDRQSVALTGTGVNLVNRFSFTPDLRTSKEQGQANFVTPGLFLFNVGMDVSMTPELTLITNASYLRFATSSPIQFVLQDNKIGRDIGVDLSVGVRYRPLLNNNIILNAGIAALVPGSGFSDIYSSETLYSAFLSATLTY